MALRGWQLRKAVRCLNRGGVIAYPTEAIYGLGCDPLNAEAVTRLLTLKQRDWRKGLILIAADFAQLGPYLQPLAPKLRKEVLSSWPGPVTWVLPAHPDVPYWLRGDHDTLAVRLTAHPIAAELCRGYGGVLVSTSANISSKPPATSAFGVRRIFGEEIDCIVHGPLGGRSRASEIRDGRTGEVLRAG